MVEGAALLAGASEFSPGELADKVASPGGSTRAGMNVLDDGNALAKVVDDAMTASRDRNAEMAAEARKT
jgi:pyrroline-5-carboxylate reductase